MVITLPFCLGRQSYGNAHRKNLPMHAFFVAVVEHHFVLPATFSALIAPAAFRLGLAVFVKTFLLLASHPAEDVLSCGRNHPLGHIPSPSRPQTLRTDCSSFSLRPSLTVSCRSYTRGARAPEATERQQGTMSPWRVIVAMDGQDTKEVDVEEAPVPEARGLRKATREILRRRDQKARRAKLPRVRCHTAPLLQDGRS